MDRLNELKQYRQAIQTFLQDYVASRNIHAETDIDLICDQERDRYLVLDIGWNGTQRIHHCIFHFDIKDDKVWIQENNTDIEVDQELEEMGISRKDMVVGFHHPSMREYSDFAVV
ncbi:MAG: XisI protein [Symploca sp. SIO2B6]|nr:XisI protein [Symploca sp. SIO2B6]